MKFHVHGYGTGSSRDPTVAKQYRNLRVKINVTASFNAFQKRSQHELDSKTKPTCVTLYGMTTKTSSDAVDNACAIQFTAASTVDNVLSAAMFLESAINSIETSYDFFKEFGKPLSFIPASKPDNIDRSMKILKSRVETLSKLIEETQSMHEVLAEA